MRVLLALFFLAIASVMKAQPGASIQFIGQFAEHKAPVSINKKFGYMNESGQMVIPCKFDYAGPFNGNFAIVRMNSHFGMINNIGEIVVKPEYDFLNIPDENGLIYAGKSGSYGVINTTGKVVIPFSYEYSGNTESFNNGIIRLKKGNAFGYLNSTGKIVVPFVYCSLGYFNENKLASAVRCSDKRAVIINSKGKIFSPEGLNEIRCEKFPCIGKVNQSYVFFDTLSLVSGKPKYIDTTNKYEWVDYYRGNLALVKMEGKYYFIDKNKKRFSEFNFEDRKEFAEGLFFLRKNNKWALFDSNATPLTDFKFDESEKFKNGFSPVYQGNKCGLINKSGKMVISPEYDEIRVVSEKYSMVRTRDNWAYITNQGKRISEFKYDIVSNNSLQGEIAIVKSKGKFGLVNLTGGKELISPEYDEITYLGEDMVSAMKNGVIIVMGTKTGKCVLFCKN